MRLKKRKTVKKPWGKFEQFVLNENCSVKVHEVKPGKRLSLQTHKFRNEYYYVLDGPAIIVIGNRTKKVDTGGEVFVNKGQKHRFGAYKNKVRILEITFGKFDEKDIKRLEDDYGRA